MNKTTKAKLIKQLEKECMALWGKAVHARAKSVCEFCGRNAQVYAHHIYSRRSHYATRFDLENSVALCFYCHQIKTHTEGSQELGLWLVEQNGKEWFETLRANAKKIVYDKLQFLEEEKKKLKEHKNETTNSINK